MEDSFYLNVMLACLTLFAKAFPYPIIKML